MVRLLGIQIPDNQKIEFALTMLYGIGWTTSGKILDQVKVEKNKKIKDLTEEEIKKIIEVIDKNYKIEGELKEKVIEDIKRLREIGSYRGLRHARNLPVRGQRTRSHFRKNRGKAVGVAKKAK